MDKEKLAELVDRGISSYQIADIEGVSQTSIMYWIKKFNLKTKKKTETRLCVLCKKELRISSAKYCSSKCRVDFQYNAYIDRWKKGIEGGHRGRFKDQISNHLRRYMGEKFDHKCVKCGWGETNIYTNKIPLQVDHLDGDHLNNSEDNLQLLCPNCHSLTATYGGANKGNGRPYRYKVRE